MAALPGQALQYHQDEEDHLHRNINHNYFIDSTVHKNCSLKGHFSLIIYTY